MNNQNIRIINSFEECIDYYGYNKLICDTKDKNECLKKYINHFILIKNI